MTNPLSLGKRRMAMIGVRVSGPVEGLTAEIENIEGVEYLVASMSLGGVFIYGAVRLYRRADRQSALRLYLFSLLYLALLFAAMVVDRQVGF